MEMAGQFAHVLLFSCPQCHSPLASACASVKRNLEQAEAQRLIGLSPLPLWVDRRRDWSDID